MSQFSDAHCPGAGRRPGTCPGGVGLRGAGTRHTDRDGEPVRGTELTHQIFWSDTYSDLRTERYFTYTPNKNVTPVVAYGDKVTSRETLTTKASG